MINDRVNENRVRIYHCNKDWVDEMEFRITRSSLFLYDEGGYYHIN